MAKLYCYKFNGYKVEEAVVEVVETEKMYRVESGNIPFIGISRVYKADLGIRAESRFIYLSALPAYDEAVEAFIVKDKVMLDTNIFYADRARERLESLYKLQKERG